ncbi:MAG: tyrosine-type recombinase/integrase [Gammaproteobacteria bacterium]|nr:tyrosine-type recombinase/integrase [Gammaproteobacteria bacterium]MCD8542287.1 tyrosine-type recombinase/integrase [Gammaproteobacteria bacterium]MCD8573743.1 tyrosine-type recombinase/integrase [Gammaproteobacteria bacterium]
MKSKKTKLVDAIKPLFLPFEDLSTIGKDIIKFARDDYNKMIGSALIDAKDDAQAISSFLREFVDSPLTLQSYAKEIERLLLWCIHVVKLNISSLRRDHLIDYQAFLKDPEPVALWCGPKVSRQLADGNLNPRWRPFYHGLSPSTISKTLTILDSFFNYLVQTRYLMGNPLAIDKRRKKRQKTKPQIIDRYLERDEIHATLDALEDYATRDNKNIFQVRRARYIILLLFYTGLRIAEAAQHTMGNIFQREGDWYLRVKGKGKKQRDIPMPDALLKALAQFRKQIGLDSPEPKFREKTPLIPMENLKQPISPRRIDQILKWAFSQGATLFEHDQPRKASKLRAASAHWLRHSYVTYLLDTGASIKVAQENAGHSDISTTMHYRHVAKNDRHEETRQLSLVTSAAPKSGKRKY